MPTLTKLYNVRLDEKLLEEAKKVAKENGANFSEWVRTLAEQAVLTRKCPLEETEEIKSRQALEQFQEDIYQGLVDIREGRYMSHDEMLERVKKW